MKTVLLALPLLISCGSDKDVVRIQTQTPQTFSGDPIISTDEELGLIVSEFYASASWLKKPVNRSIKSIQFVDSMPDDAVGLCYAFVYSNGKPYFRKIEILKSFWDTATPQTKRVLVYHELGHCALDLNHKPVNSPTIMAPYVLSDKVSTLSWYFLVKGMFETQPFSLVDSEIPNHDVVINYLD